MADIKLISLDLDGTLLTTDKRLTDRTKATLKAARDRGVDDGAVLPARHQPAHAALLLAAGRV